MGEDVVEIRGQGQPSEVVGVDLHVAVVREEVVCERVRSAGAVDEAAADADVASDAGEAWGAREEAPRRSRCRFDWCSVRIERHGRGVDVAGEPGPVGPNFLHLGLPVPRTVGGVE